MIGFDAVKKLCVEMVWGTWSRARPNRCHVYFKDVAPKIDFKDDASTSLPLFSLQEMTAPDHLGNTPLHYACQNGSSQPKVLEQWVDAYNMACHKDESKSAPDLFKVSSYDDVFKSTALHKDLKNRAKYENLVGQTPTALFHPDEQEIDHVDDTYLVDRLRDLFGFVARSDQVCDADQDEKQVSAGGKGKKRADQQAPRALMPPLMFAFPWSKIGNYMYHMLSRSPKRDDFLHYMLAGQQDIKHVFDLPLQSHAQRQSENDAGSLVMQPMIFFACLLGAIILSPFLYVCALVRHLRVYLARQPQNEQRPLKMLMCFFTIFALPVWLVQLLYGWLCTLFNLIQFSLKQCVVTLGGALSWLFRNKTILLFATMIGLCYMAQYFAHHFFAHLYVMQRIDCTCNALCFFFILLGSAYLIYHTEQNTYGVRRWGIPTIAMVVLGGVLCIPEPHIAAVFDLLVKTNMYFFILPCAVILIFWVFPILIDYAYRVGHRISAVGQSVARGEGFSNVKGRKTLSSPQVLSEPPQGFNRQNTPT